MKKTHFIIIFVILFSITVSIAQAVKPNAVAVKVHSLFSDNMVIQRGQIVYVWGQAKPHGTVRVSLNGKSKSVSVKANGTWRVKLPAIKHAGGPYDLLIEGEKKRKYKNIMSGDVWICSGQSNMEWPVRSSKNAKQEIAAANYPQIRLFTSPNKVSYQRSDTMSERNWKICSPQTVGWFSAVAYFFGRKLNRDLNVPIGLIDVSWGGTPGEAWVSLAALNSDSNLLTLVKRFQKKRAKMTPEAISKHEKALTKWRKQKKKNNKIPRPNAPWGRPRYLPGVLFNGMINPLLTFGIKGVIWYQGEANARRAKQYQKLLKLLICEWRKEWQREDFPFLIVQLANFKKGRRALLKKSWAYLREAQYMALQLPATALVVACDIGEPLNIHPSNKQEVGRRLALAAEKTAYGINIVYSGPEYKKVKFIDDKGIILFKHVGGGLIAKNGPLKYFEIAGKERIFFKADAIINANKVIVSSLQVSKPVAIRYAWLNNPEGCNFYNKEGLPAIPFRTDSWPGVTEQNQ